jgi:sugar phosphate permease
MSTIVTAPAAIRQRFSFYRGWWIVVSGFLSQMVILGASGYVFGLLILPTEQELGWSRTLIVGVLTVSSLVAGIVAARLGPYVDRNGSRILMTVSCLLGGACLFLLGFVTQPWQYYLCWAGFGLSTPGLLALGPGVSIANWFIRRRTLAFSIFSLGSATAGIVLTPVIAWVVQVTDWRTAWQVMGVSALALAPLAWLTIRRRPEDHGLLPDGDRPDSPEVARRLAARAREAGEDEQAWTVRDALHTRSFWLMTLAFMLMTFPASSIWVQLAPFVASKGFATGAMATILVLYGVGCLGGRPLWGLVVSRLGIHRTLVAFAFAYALSIVLFQVPSSLGGIYAVTVILGLAIGGMQQLNAQAFPDYFGRRIVGTLLGYAGIFFTVTRALAPLFLALSFDLTRSYAAALWVFAIACFIASLAFLLAPPPAGSRAHQAASLKAS